MNLGSYGFDVSMSGDSIQKVSQLDTSLNKLDATARNTTNNLSGGFQNFSNSFKNIFGAFTLGNLAAGAIQKGISNITEFISGSTNAFIEAEKSEKMLTFSAYQLAGATEKSISALIDQSKELQLNTIFSDETTRAAQNMLVNFGLTTSEVKNMIPAMQDLASISGKSLEEIVQLTERGILGQGRGLKMLLPNIVLTKDKTQNLITITKELNKFQGASRELFESSAGKIEYYKNMIDEMQEKLGESTIGFKLWWQEVKLDAFDFLIAKWERLIELITSLGEIPVISDIFPQLREHSQHEKTVKRKKEEREEAKGYFDIYQKELEGFYKKFGKGLGKNEFFNYLLADTIKLEKLSEQIYNNFDKIDTSKFTQSNLLVPHSVDAVKQQLKRVFEYIENYNFKEKKRLTGEGGSMNVSNLSGAAGGLGEAKVINIRIETMQKIEVENGDGKDIIQKSPMAIEELVRVLNNITPPQSAIM